MNYLIVFNHNQATFNPTDIHNTITNLLGLTDWWHYLPNVYIVSTTKNEKYLADKIIEKHPGLLFLVVGVNLTLHNGVLPKNAWEWISRKIKTVFRVKPAQAPPKDYLSNLLNITPQRIRPRLTGNKILDDLFRGIK